MPNQRIFYASHAVKVGGTVVQGAQSVSVNTNFNLDQVFQLGQLAIYDNISTDPDVEITITKALDGFPLMYTLAVGGGSIVSNANDRTDIIVGVGADTNTTILSNTSSITMTGCFITNLSYTIPVDGNMTEEIQFVGSHKIAGGAALAPNSTGPNDNVLRRQHLHSSTVLPSAVSGTNLSNISISASLNREKMYTLGQFSPFHRFVNFPLEVTCSFDVIAKEIDTIAIDEVHTRCDGRVQPEEPISIVLCTEGGAARYTFNLGVKCKMQSVNYSGGDTSGGNVTLTYTYITYNDLSITG